ncbi:MAG: ATP-dependent DNA helicase [Actinobacteria bacterium]|nr:ATP-dependent DNA helicase [Actinomycetota bacterium]
MSDQIKYRALDIAHVLAKRDSSYRTPTDEQIAIIESPLEPAVVIAGAGSGKTETMSARVLYLVANGLVQPDEILGLTFTRKAAGELAKRVRVRLRQLREADLAPKKSANGLSDASIMTYHSYAGRLLSEHSIRCGVDAGEEPIGEAALWQMTAALVHNWPDENFTSESAVSTVIKDVIGLSRLVLEHGVTTAQIEDVSLPILAHLESLGTASNPASRKILQTLTQRLSILPMVFELQARRQRDGLLSFDDQMSLAATIAEQFQDVREIESSRYRVVLLDEYQDTSQSQVRMLSALYGSGHSVMAVGDPCQAIYTWRGASAGTIGAFAKNFPKSSSQKGRAQFSLSTTFRNDKIVLDLANVISDQIRHNKSVDVAPLVARSGAGRGELACGVFETIETEAIAIAEYFSKLWPAQVDSGNAQVTKRKSFAVLVRKRSQIPEIELALREANLPYEVLGVGGLIQVAEVADLISLLRIVTNPDSGASLMRHLTGPRINLGAADIAALGRFSRSLAEGVHEKSVGLIAKISAGNPLQEEADDQFSGSLIDALDEIEKANRDHFTVAGYKRLVQFASDLRRLRSRAGGSLSDLISEIENYLFLDVEVYLRDSSQSGRRHLDRFIDEAAKFSRSGASINDFLTWLDIAAAEEGGLKSGTPEINEDVVSILTIHMAKGLEWDVVAIPGLAERNFPSTGKERDNWLTNEKHIPFQLRGDGSELPTFDIFSTTSHARVTDVFEAFNSECDLFKRAEEIRLGYVAITRARTHLICTTSRWRDGATPVEPSELYRSVADVAALQGGVILSDISAPTEGEKNPRLEEPKSGVWPRDPLGSRRDVFDAGVERVRTAIPHSLEDSEEDTEDEKLNSWIHDAQALVNEIHQSKKSVDVTLPPRLSVSSMVALRENPEELALSIRRPMPRPQDEYSRRGSVFHLWVEKHFGQGTLFDDEDLDPVDPFETDQTLEGLKSAWLASEWAERHPYAVEVPFETVLAGILVRGRIDAVYKIGNRFEVVDWKTGSKKLGEAAAIQLALYRLAWAQLQKVDITEVSAAFHYVPTGVTDRPADLLDREGLVALLEKY